LRHMRRVTPDELRSLFNSARVQSAAKKRLAALA
jgi:hypothetical protein